MKSDIDKLMQERNIDFLLVTGSGQNNPPMVYLTGGGHLTSADLIKARGKEPVLFCSPMERDEAARTGLPTRNVADYKFQDLVKQYDGDTLKATARRYQLMMADLGITGGRMALYGKVDAGASFSTYSALQQMMPGLEIVPETGISLLVQAMATKDEIEVGRIRKMGQITTWVVGQVADFLSSQMVKDEVLVLKDGQPVTIGLVKNKINLWLAERGADNPEGTIFAIGHDAGVPHSTGKADDLLRLGQTIVFDIYPCEAGGGYHYDFTRTWCLGYAPDEAQKLYADVHDVYQQAMSNLELNAWFRNSQELACDLFEAKGHPTIKSDPLTQEGYVHGLGHGLGLYIHERPMSGLNATDADRLFAGSVVTIEPGLYYPERGLGMRLEDTVWARPDGKFEILAPYPLDLVLPVKVTH
jgi:Xaa-Pro aminopeptidase